MYIKNAVSIEGYETDEEGRFYDLAVLFALNFFKIPEDVSISVELDELDDGLNGFIIDSDEENKFFNIVIEKRGRMIQQNIQTIFHEMTHVKQHIYDNLSEFLDAPDKPEYSKRWWEIEAFVESVNLTKGFIVFLTDHKETPIHELHKLI